VQQHNGTNGLVNGHHHCDDNPLSSDLENDDAAQTQQPVQQQSNEKQQQQPQQQQAEGPRELDCFEELPDLTAALKALSEHSADPLAFLQPNTNVSQAARQAARVSC